MRVAVLASASDLSGYVAEILKTWGLALYDLVEAGAARDVDPAATPVVVVPAGKGGGDSSERDESLIAYARQGGTVVSFEPRGRLAEAAGLEWEGEREVPLRLRVTDFPAAGLGGELLPIVGRAAGYVVRGDGSPAPLVPRPLAYLSHPGRFAGETVGIAETCVGCGRIIVFAFDLPLCVLMLRQGDPARSEVIPSPDRCARPSHLAADFDAGDAAWIPFADLLARLLVDIVRAHLPAPVPLFSHLPARAAGILLYSGDEDGAQVAWNDEELSYVAAACGRMNLYIIPVNTNSTRADVERYRSRHDVGPHPDLRGLDGRSVQERLAELDRQIRMFGEMFGVTTRSVRNHCTAWAGYLEPAEVMEKLGVRMDANYFSGTYLRDRMPAPYAGFGGAMPMRFCDLDGHLIHVFQQHTHASDDVFFHATVDYSYKLSAAQYETVLRRILTDITTRFHTPYGVCIHPSNWVRYSREQGRALLRQAAEFGLPVWSYDQWSRFWDVRDSWRIHNLEWDGCELKFVAAGTEWNGDLRIALPYCYEGLVPAEVEAAGERMPWERVVRFDEPLLLCPLPAGRTEVPIRVRYRRPQAVRRS